MVSDYLNWKQRFVWLAIFAVAMGFLEGVVVIYVRELYYPEGFAFPLKLLPAPLLNAEMIREAATLIMLAAVGIIAGRNSLQKLFYFLFAFGVWDITYYGALKLLLGWPPSLLTRDLLFLIPVSWMGPVLAPLINSLTMILMALLFIGRQEKGYYMRMRLPDWVLMIGGALIILYTYLADYLQLVWQSGILSPARSQEAAERLTEMVSSYIPGQYRWLLFIIGEAVIVAAVINVTIISFKYKRDETFN